MRKRNLTADITGLILFGISLATAPALDRRQDLRQYGHQSWQTDNGLPQNTVRAVLQTRDGYLWLGTDGGLVRFDGVQFVVYDKQSGVKLRSNSINSLFEDRAGALWISTADGLTRRRGAEFTTFTTTDGLPGNSILSVFESRGEDGREEGKLWALTAEGLAVFSNGRFSPVPLGAGLSNSGAIAEAADGSLWIGTTEGIVHLKDGSPAPEPGGLAHLETQALAIAFDGRVWVGTRAGVEVVNGGEGIGGSDGQVTILNHQQGLPADEVTALLADRSGRVWIGTANGLAVVESGKITAYGVKEGLPGERIQAFYQDREGAIWISTNRGMARFEDSRSPDRQAPAGSAAAGSTAAGSTSAAHFQAFGPREGLSGEVVLSMFEDREGSLWLGTESGGMTVLHDQKFTTYTTATGLSEDLVRSVYQDRQGTLWIGTNGGGLDRLDAASSPPSPTNRSPDPAMSSTPKIGSSVESPVESSVGSPVGSSASGKPNPPVTSLAKASGFTNLSTAGGLSSNIVLALADDSAGNLWIGTPDGLNQLHDGHVTVFTSADGLADDFVRSLYASTDGSLWIGTRRGLSHLENGHFTSYTSMDGLGSDLVGALLEQRHGPAAAGAQPALSKQARIAQTGDAQTGGLWIGTLGGLSRYQNGRFFTLTTRDGLSSNIVTAIHEDAHGTLWIGTSGGGLNRLQGGVITVFPVAGTELPENIYAILEDAQGNLWLSSDKGIYRIAMRDLDAFASGSLPRLMPEVYGAADGMAISECSSGGHPAAWRLRDGTLAFATLKGVAEIDPQHAPANTRPPPVAIEQVTFDDRVLDDTMGDQRKSLALPPGQGRLAFEYTAMSFVAPQKVRFRYKLEGFDHDWVDAGARRTAYYTNIPPGRYTFRVLACNNDGVWNEAGASLQLRLRPHFYQTWIFDLLLLALAALLAALIAWLVSRRRVQRVELQFGAALAERGRIAREIHDTLAQSLVAISVQLEVVSRLLTSAAGPARDHLDQARILTRNSLTEARSSIWALRSEGAAATADGANEALATRLSAMGARVTAGTSIKFQSKVGGAYHPLPAKLEAELLSIAQEAVTNAVRHADPQHVRIGLLFEPRLLTMVIEDDGCGFSGQPHPQSSGPEGHFGLTGMRERAAEIGGTLLVESTPGNGTLVRVQVPIE